MKTPSIFKQMNMYIKRQQKFDVNCTAKHSKRWKKSCYRCRVAAVRVIRGLGINWR